MHNAQAWAPCIFLYPGSLDPAAPRPDCDKWHRPLPEWQVRRVLCGKWTLGIDRPIGQNFPTDTSGENNDDTAHHHRRRENRGRAGPAQGIRRPAGLSAGRFPALAGVRQERARRQPLGDRRDRTDAHRRPRALQFQVRQWPSGQSAGRAEHGDGLWRAGAGQHRRTAADQRTDVDHRAADRRHLRPGRARPGASGIAPHGLDRQWRAKRVPGPGIPSHPGHRHPASV